MKQPGALYSRLGKVVQGLCVKPDNQETIETAALDRALKHHAKYCAYWIFSGDRHCSCGRDEVRAELETLKARSANGAAKKV